MTKKVKVALTTETNKDITILMANDKAQFLANDTFGAVKVMEDLWEFKMRNEPIYLSKSQCRKVLKEIFFAGQYR